MPCGLGGTRLASRSSSTRAGCMPSLSHSLALPGASPIPPEPERRHPAPAALSAHPGAREQGRVTGTLLLTGDLSTGLPGLGVGAGGRVDDSNDMSGSLKKSLSAPDWKGLLPP